MSEKSIKLRISKFVLFLIVFVCLITLIAVYYVIKPLQSQPVYSIQVGEEIVVFRADVNKAFQVPVYPDEQALYRELMNPLVKNITIAFKPADETENPYYSLQILELIPKLAYAYSRLKYNPTFSREPLIVDSYENLPGKIQNPIIALVHPIYSNETAIRVDGHVVYLKAKTHEDFDLVTVKLLLVALDAKQK
jgi:hypothetical protein